MLVSCYVEIKLNSNNVKYYESLGYEIPMKKSKKNRKGREYVYDLDKSITVQTKDLPRYSKAIVKVECYYCKKQKEIPYCQYMDSFESCETYACDDCRLIKAKESTFKKYGVYTYAQASDFKDKVCKTIHDKYGCNNVSQVPIVKHKKSTTFYNNSSQKSSRQQRYICTLYSGILNFPIGFYNADIYLSDSNLICEYNGSGHDLNVKTGRESIEEYERKEIIRARTMKQFGYKQMTIISKTDVLPHDIVLLQMLKQAKEYFSNYPEHSWIEFNVDTSTVRNAEQKDGVFFDYGKLRRIKKSDLLDSQRCA